MGIVKDIADEVKNIIQFASTATDKLDKTSRAATCNRLIVWLRLY